MVSLEPPQTRMGVLDLFTKAAGAEDGRAAPMLMMPLSSVVDDSWSVTDSVSSWMFSWLDVTWSVLTSKIQSSHTTLPKTKDHDFPRYILTLYDQIILQQTLEHSGALAEASIDIETTAIGVKDDIVAPVEAA